MQMPMQMNDKYVRTWKFNANAEISEKYMKFSYLAGVFLIFPDQKLLTFNGSHGFMLFVLSPAVVSLFKIGP